MKLSSFDYKYPDELVAQRPLPQRDASKMMVINRSDGNFEHSRVFDLPNQLRAGDLLVINNSKVFPARLFGTKESGDGPKIELLLLKEVSPSNKTWTALATRKKRLREGTVLKFHSGLTATILDNRDTDLLIQFETDQEIFDLLKRIGLPPLPPYIKRETKEDYTDEDRERYQTVYAEHPGSAAAPTAGFHLSDEILARLRERGVEIVPVTLHVGLDTFSPVRVGNIKNHKMHGESYIISEESETKINRAKAEGRRVIAVGTTTVRALESFWQGPPSRHTTSDIRNTNLFVYPGHRFKIVDVLLTNFHQPRSTLLMMVAALAGREFILQMYAEAIKRRYRLFSYGDCMLIV